MTRYTLTFDPGMSTGIALGRYGDNLPWELVTAYQIENGLEGFLQWWDTDGKWLPGGEARTFAEYGTTRISERFVPLAGQGFALTAKAIEPLRIEGALVTLGLLPADPTSEGWQRPQQMYFSGGTNKATRLKASREFLRTHGLLQTGKMVGRKDADDANSAILHSLAFMRRIQHHPTLAHYWPDV